jgi:adenylate cyclase
MKPPLTRTLEDAATMSTASNTKPTPELGLMNTLLERPLRQPEIQPMLENLLSQGGAYLVHQLGDVFEKMATLIYVANQVSNTIDLNTLLDRIVKIATEVSECERGTLFLNDAESNELFARVAGGDLRQEIRFPNHLGIAGSVFTSGEAVLIPDAYADPRFNQEVDRKTGFKTRNILCAPIRTSAKEIIGVMQLLNHVDGTFTSDDLVLLEAVTSQAASALVNARLVEEIQRAREEEARMQDVVTSVSSELQLRPLLAKIVEVISDLLDADRSTVFLNDRKTNELYSFLAQGVGSGEIRFPNHLGIAGTVFTTGETMNIPDAYADARFNQAIDKQTGYRTRSILCMPIRTREGKKLGVTQVVNKNGGPFHKADERRLATFTSQVSIAIENATLFDEVANMKNYNESMLESMSNGLVTLDEDGHIQKCNHSFERIFKTKQAEVAGHDASQFFSGSNVWIAESIGKVVATDRAEVTMDTEVVLSERDRSSVNLNTVPLKGAKGEKLGTMLVFEDITSEKRVKSTMARYMAKEVAEKLLEAGEEALGGVCQTASVLFSDIRSFTTLAEALGPQETVAMLNEYFTVMVDVVFRQGGVLDKFIGDALMALFGVPFKKDDDADRAVRSGIDMLRELRKLNKARQASGKRQIKIGVGINTDEVVSGNIGSMKRMDYTAIGDGVNLASRLESSCKTYGAELIISEFTKRALHDCFKMREIDLVRVQGKLAPVAIYEVLDHCDEEAFPHIPQMIEMFGEGLSYYRGRHWHAGIECFEEILKLNPMDRLSEMYVSRCQHFIDNPPDDDWSGVWVMTTK